MKDSSDILMTVDRQGKIRHIGDLGMALFMRQPGDYFPVICRYDGQVQSLSLNAYRQDDTMEFWLAPMRNPVGDWDGFAVIRRHTQAPVEALPSAVPAWAASELRSAIQRGDFFLVYQPEHRQKGQRNRAAEALLRWRQSEHRVLNAGEFVPALEYHGLDVELGWWIIDEVCQQNRRWQMKGLRPLSISVNLSPAQLAHADLFERTREALEFHGLPAHYLQFEVNARCMHGDGYADAKILHRLKHLGIRIMLDDCDNSRRSWHQLLLWPIDAIKLRAEAWDDTLISVARGLGKAVIVQMHDHPIAIDSAYQADAEQGDLICRPLAAEQLASILDQGGWAA